MNAGLALLVEDSALKRDMDGVAEGDAALGHGELEVDVLAGLNGNKVVTRIDVRGRAEDDRGPIGQGVEVLLEEADAVGGANVGNSCAGVVGGGDSNLKGRGELIILDFHWDFNIFP